MNNKYGYIGTEAKIGRANTQAEPCENSKKRLKENLARQKDNKAFILEAMNRDFFDYNEVHKALGRVEVNILYIKEDLKQLKKRKGKK